MKGAVLEVGLVSAEGIDKTIIFGHPYYYVVIECGTQICRSKSSSGRLDKIYWNEKFTFELLPSELETLRHLKLRILKEGFLSDGKFVGETMIFLGGIIVEGNNRGWIELSPANFNVEWKDKTYRGQMTVAIKFIPNVDLKMERNDDHGHMHKENNPRRSIRGMIRHLIRVLTSCGDREFISMHKKY